MDYSTIGCRQLSKPIITCPPSVHRPSHDLDYAGQRMRPSSSLVYCSSGCPGEQLASATAASSDIPGENRREHRRRRPLKLASSVGTL